MTYTVLVETLNHAQSINQSVKQIDIYIRTVSISIDNTLHTADGRTLSQSHWMAQLIERST